MTHCGVDLEIEWEDFITQLSAVGTCQDFLMMRLRKLRKPRICILGQHTFGVLTDIDMANYFRKQINVS